MADEKVSHEYTPDAGAGTFVMRIAQEGKATVDGRIFDKESISWRNPPIPLMFHRANDPTGRGGHKASVAVGSITDIWSEQDEEGFSTVFGRGFFASDDEGQQARQLIQEGVISGVSADVGGAVTEELEAEFGPDGEAILHKRIKSGEIVAVTALPIPAFDNIRVSEEAITAAGGETWTPPTEWFANPNLEEATPITVTADGRVFGHVAAWGTCHIGYKDRCVTPPRSRSNYQFYNVGKVLTADGNTVSVGRITAGTGHAAIEFSAKPAVDHYDNTGWAAAFVASGEDGYGIWVAGSIAPGATEEQIATLRASSISGDWRSINGNLEMVGVLAVNTPGFPIASPKAGLVAGAQVSLIAAGAITTPNTSEEGENGTNEALNTEDCACEECGCGGGKKKHKKKMMEYSEEEIRINMPEDDDIEELSEEDCGCDEAEELAEEGLTDMEIAELDAFVLFPEDI